MAGLVGLLRRAMLHTFWFVCRAEVDRSVTPAAELLADKDVWIACGLFSHQQTVLCVPIHNVIITCQNSITHVCSTGQ